MAEEGSNGVKLISTWESPFSIRARTALHLKSVPYEYVEQKVYVQDAKTDLLEKYNPIHKKVPVLVHGERPICESLNILQYIEEAWPSPSLLPSDPFDRSIARFWTQYIDEQCFAASLAVLGAKDDEGRTAAAAKLESYFAVLEEGFKKCSKGGDFFGGDNIGYVDIACGALLGPLWIIEKLSGLLFIREDKTPGLFRWSEKFCAHEAVKPYMPTVDEFVEFATKKFNAK